MTRGDWSARLVGVANYGMLPVLLLLCVVFSYFTYSEKFRDGADAGEASAELILQEFGPQARVAIFAQDNPKDAKFVEVLTKELQAAGVKVVGTSEGRASDAEKTLAKIAAAGEPVDVLACTRNTATWSPIERASEEYPQLGKPRVVLPPKYWWPTFLMPSNLRNIADNTSVIAIMAIGMTMVIITGGIDLSVGSLVALSAVVSTMLIRNIGGSLNATPLSMVLCCLVGIGLCGLLGLFSGSMITLFRLPAFIVTLSMMLIARGAAQRMTLSESIFQIPQSFNWLGGGADLGGIPNSVVLMAVLYVVAFVLMHHTVLGRYIYAVGGNMEAARLSGVPVRRVLLFAYVASGLLAGLGGVMMASQLKSGSSNYGVEYELKVIAAVVVGGTSIFGGEGRILGSLIGALIMSVIQTGMNLTEVRPETQPIVLGFVILAAVLLDKFKQEGWRLRSAAA